MEALEEGPPILFKVYRGHTVNIGGQEPLKIIKRYTMGSGTIKTPINPYGMSQQKLEAWELVVGVLVIIILQIYGNNNFITMILWIIVCVVILMGLSLFKYSEKGEMGSYHNMITLYEKNLLDKKIKQLVNKISVTDTDEKFLKSQQSIIKKLVKLRNKARLPKKTGA